MSTQTVQPQRQLTYRVAGVGTQFSIVHTAAVHRLVTHGNDPRSYGSVLRAVGLNQVSLQPIVLPLDVVVGVAPVVDFSVKADDVHWAQVPAGNCRKSTNLLTELAGRCPPVNLSWPLMSALM
jgi:hypothetical protein